MNTNKKLYTTTYRRLKSQTFNLWMFFITFPAKYPTKADIIGLIEKTGC